MPSVWGYVCSMNNTKGTTEMKMMVCSDCGRVVSNDYVNMTDECSNCKTSPFREWPEGVYLGSTRTPDTFRTPGDDLSVLR